MTKAMRYIMLMACIILAVAASAVPLRRDTTFVVQPDGKRLRITVTGDENGWCYCTADGAAVVRAMDGSWKYVSHVIDGTPIAGPLAAHEKADRSLQEQECINSYGNIAARIASVRRTDADGTYALSTRAGSASGHYITGSYPRTGKQKCLVVLVEFPDRPFSRPVEQMLSYYTDMFNSPGYTETVKGKAGTYVTPGSVRDYFEQQSYGLFSPSFIVVGPVMADSSYTYYGKNRGRNDSTERTGALVREICRKITERNMADLSDYDTSGKGEVDFLGIVYAGRGENYEGADPNTIWPHKHYVQGSFGSISKVNYFMTCELFWDSDDVIDGMGTFCHEFSHILGLPDFYDSSQNFILGKWSLMDYGTYAAEGFVPSGYTAFERYCLGWLDLTDISDPGTYMLEDLSLGQAYRMGTDNADRFLILESHNRKGWFSYQDADGLMLTAVSYDGYRNSSMPNSSQKRYSIIPADNSFKYETEYGDLYPYEGSDSVTWYSRPALAIGGQDYQGLRLYNIRYSSGTSSFTLGTDIANSVMMPETDETIIRCSGSEVTVTAPDGTAAVLYDISGKQIMSVTISGGKGTMQLPGHGVWIIRCGSATRKVSC